MEIKFGTDGWRAIIAKEFTYDNLEKAAYATAQYFMEHPHRANGVAVGYDTRFMSREFAAFTARVISSFGLKVFLSDGVVPTPAVSFYVKRASLAGGIMITASHNPSIYNGFKIKADYGGSAHPETIAEVEAKLRALPFRISYTPQPDLVTRFDMRGEYLSYLASELPLDAIASSGMKIGHNPMFGAGRGLVSALLPSLSIAEFHAEIDPTFGGISPEPLPQNSEDFRTFLLEKQLDVGIINDGDADRIGMLDEAGRFIDSHKLFAIILKYLLEVKSMTGEVARTYALTEVIDKICKKHGITVHNLPIGFKHVGKLMTTRPIIMGGEESGGIGITAHLPERDGVYIGMVVLEIMAIRKKRLSELVEELYHEYGYFTYTRIDAHLTEAEKVNAIRHASRGDFKDIDGMTVTRFEHLDGFKYFFDGGWLLIRPSGTEPVLRLYCEAENEDKVTRALSFAESLAFRA